MSILFQLSLHLQITDVCSRQFSYDLLNKRNHSVVFADMSESWQATCEVVTNFPTITDSFIHPVVSHFNGILLPSLCLDFFKGLNIKELD